MDRELLFASVCKEHFMIHASHLLGGWHLLGSCEGPFCFRASRRIIERVSARIDVSRLSQAPAGRSRFEADDHLPALEEGVAAAGDTDVVVQSAAGRMAIGRMSMGTTEDGRLHYR